MNVAKFCIFVSFYIYLAYLASGTGHLFGVYAKFAHITHGALLVAQIRITIGAARTIRTETARSVVLYLLTFHILQTKSE